MGQTVGMELTKSLGMSRECDGATTNLIEEYDRLVSSDRFSWSSNVQFVRQLGAGGQGAVFLADRFGSDGFNVPIAVKFFSPERYASLEEYDQDMARIARVSTQVSQIRHPYLLGVDHFINRDRIRVMVMEWVQGFDLRRLLTTRFYGLVKERVSRKLWEAFNDQLVTSGPVQPRLRSQMMLAIVKNIVESVVALHEDGIVHGDIKPSNIMLSRSGSAKLIDIGSAVPIGEKTWRNGCTPAYAAVEVLDGAAPTPETDLVSLGYLAIELLVGKPLFADVDDLCSLMAAKRQLESRFEELLPHDIGNQDLIVDLLRCLISATRFNAPAGICAVDLVKEMLEDFPIAAPASLGKVWVEELWEVDASAFATEMPE